MFVYFITLCLGYDTNHAARVLESCIQCLSYSAIVCIGVFLILQRLARGFLRRGGAIIAYLKKERRRRRRKKKEKKKKKKKKHVVK